MLPIPEKMKLNKFIKVHIPRNRDLLSRYGYRVTAKGSSVPDDCRIVDSSNRKLDNFAAVQNEIYRSYAKEQNEIERQRAAQSLENHQNSDTAESV